MDASCALAFWRSTCPLPVASMASLSRARHISSSSLARKGNHLHGGLEAAKTQVDLLGSKSKLLSQPGDNHRRSPWSAHQLPKWMSNPAVTRRIFWESSSIWSWWFSASTPSPIVTWRAYHLTWKMLRSRAGVAITRCDQTYSKLK